MFEKSKIGYTGVLGVQNVRKKCMGTFIKENFCLLVLKRVVFRRTEKKELVNTIITSI